MFTANTLFLVYFVLFWERTIAEGLAILWQKSMGDGTSPGLGMQQEILSFLFYLPSPNQPNGRGHTVRCWKTLISHKE